MSYNRNNLPYIKGFSTKIKHSRKRIQTERGNLSISLGTNYLEPEDENNIRGIIYRLEEVEEIQTNLEKKFKTIIKALEQ